MTSGAAGVGPKAGVMLDVHGVNGDSDGHERGLASHNCIVIRTRQLGARPTLAEESA